MMQPSVSIIIPFFNRVEILKETLDSITSQEESSWECILIDDGSEHEELEKLVRRVEHDSRFKVIKRPDEIQKGSNPCRNYGFTISSGKYIQWFDSDDIMHPDYLSEKLKRMGDDVDVVVSRTRYANYELTRFREARFKYDDLSTLFIPYALDQLEIHTSSPMWSRNFLSDKKLFDESFSRYQDNDFHSRMLAEGARAVIIEKELATVRGGSGHPDQISSNQTLSTDKLLDIYRYRQNCLVLYRKHYRGKSQGFTDTIHKKMIWSFYEVMKYGNSKSKRFGILLGQIPSLLKVAFINFGTFVRTLRASIYSVYLIIIS